MISIQYAYICYVGVMCKKYVSKFPPMEDGRRVLAMTSLVDTEKDLEAV